MVCRFCRSICGGGWCTVDAWPVGWRILYFVLIKSRCCGFFYGRCFVGGGSGADDFSKLLYKFHHEAEQQLLKEREAESLRRGLLAAADFRCIAGQPEGRRFIRRLLGECGVHQASFTGEPLTMAYREGRRSVGLWLQALFDDCPHLYIRLLQPGESASEEGEA